MKSAAKRVLRLDICGTCHTLHNDKGCVQAALFAVFLLFMLYVERLLIL